MRVWICTTHRCTISAMDSCVFFNTNVWLRMGYPSITNILTFKRLPIPPPHTTCWLSGSIRKANDNERNRTSISDETSQRTVYLNRLPLCYVVNHPFSVCKGCAGLINIAHSDILCDHVPDLNIDILLFDEVSPSRSQPHHTTLKYWLFSTYYAPILSNTGCGKTFGIPI